MIRSSPASAVRRYAATFLILTLLGLTGACSGLDQSLLPNTTPEYFQPPEVIAVSPITLSTPTPKLAPTATPVFVPTTTCNNNLTFIEDVSIPDGTPVQAGEVLDKRWRVSNSGTCNWDDRFRLKLIAGPDLGAPAEQALFPARRGAEATIRLLFVAPEQPGTQRSAWQATSPEGDTFGDPIYIEIEVLSSAVSP